jgi:hypothetical protein
VDSASEQVKQERAAERRAVVAAGNSVLLRLSRAAVFILSAAFAVMTFIPWALSVLPVFRERGPVTGALGVLVPLVSLEVLRRAWRAERDRGPDARATTAFFLRHAAFLFGCLLVWIRVFAQFDAVAVEQRSLAWAAALNDIAAASGVWLLPLCAWAILWIWMKD